MMRGLLQRGIFFRLGKYKCRIVAIGEFLRVIQQQYSIMATRSERWCAPNWYVDSNILFKFLGILWCQAAAVLTTTIGVYNGALSVQSNMAIEVVGTTSNSIWKKRVKLSMNLGW